MPDDVRENTAKKLEERIKLIEGQLKVLAQAIKDIETYTGEEFVEAGVDIQGVKFE